jgi:putative DNA primase/helicase
VGDQVAVETAFSENGSAEPPKQVKVDDAKLARALLEHWKGNAKVINGRWCVFEGGYWAEREEHEVKSSAWDFIEQYPIYVPITAGKIESVVKLAGYRSSVTDRTVNALTDARARYINLRNGLYDVESHSLEPHNRDLYFTHQLPFAHDPNAKCPNFQQYLKTSLVKPEGIPDKDMVGLVMQALGYSMTGRTDLKSSFWLVGVPDSGKSVLIALIRTLMGSLHTTLDLNQIGENKFMMSHIVGKRVVTFTEASASSMLNDALYKAMVGGRDELWADVKGTKGITFVPEAKFWWAMNSAPRTKDRSGAVLNRLRIILFNRSIPPAERIEDLDRRLAGELPGIFNLAMVWYKHLCKTGTFVTPEQSEQWRHQYKDENDTEAAFIRECCEVDPNFHVSARELYNRYREWCLESGFAPQSINGVPSHWRRLGFTDVRHRDGYPHYYGLKLR